MCMISMVMDGYQPWEKWPKPEIVPNVPIRPIEVTQWVNGVSQEEFDKLKKEVEELKNLLKAAIKFDRNTGQPDCQNEEKFALLRAMADALGVDLQDVVESESD